MLYNLEYQYHFTSTCLYKTMLSITIITKNESFHIRQCLESVAWADEIIVLDSGSSDNTVDICREYTDKVYVTDWPGFGIQKQRALDKAPEQWVLSIDADETVTPELKKEIIQVINHGGFDAYKIPRMEIYCGHPIKRGGLKRKYTLRLFRRTKGHFTKLPVHESIKTEGSVGRLKQILTHESHIDLEEVLYKINKYSSLSSEVMLSKGMSSTLTKAVIKTLWAFFHSYFIQLLFLDGKFGFMYAITIAEESYYKHVKLMLLKDGLAN